MTGLAARTSCARARYGPSAIRRRYRPTQKATRRHRRSPLHRRLPTPERKAICASFLFPCRRSRMQCARPCRDAVGACCCQIVVKIPPRMLIEAILICNSNLEMMRQGCNRNHGVTPFGGAAAAADAAGVGGGLCPFHAESAAISPT